MKEDCFHLGIKALIRNKEGKILLLKTNPAMLKGYSGDPYWDIPGGRLHRDSTIEDTLLRELKEETGIVDLKSMTPFSMTLSNIRIPLDNTSVGLILSTYICEVENMDNIVVSEEHTSFNWFSPEEAAKLLEFKYPKEFVDRLKELH